MGAAILGCSRHVTKDAMSYSLEDISSCDISSPEAIVCLIVRPIMHPFRDGHSREECLGAHIMRHGNLLYSNK
jgi:hypothetical protein